MSLEISQPMLLPMTNDLMTNDLMTPHQKELLNNVKLLFLNFKRINLLFEKVYLLMSNKGEL